MWIIAQGNGRHHSMASSGAAAAEDEDEELDDAELARRLQAEEDMATYEHYNGRGYTDGLQDEYGLGAEAAGEDGVVEEERPLTYEDLGLLGDLAGRVSKGLSAEAIAALPEVAASTLGEALDKCAICQLEHEPNDTVKVLPCRHCYHPECVGAWLADNKVCPMCSKEVAA